MHKVYVIASEPSSMRSVAPALESLGGKSVRPFAWVLPWVGTASQLRRRLAGLTPQGSGFVIAEILGDWELV
jgi:hypothetical protein